jgi:nucleotide-binding universal stress UspA family protein
MGLGTKTRLSQYIYGSHSTDIAGRIKCPVIVVPESYKKHLIKTLLVCVDNAEELHNSNLHDIENFIRLSKVKLKLLHVRTENEIFNPIEQGTIILGKKYKLETLKAKYIEDGVLKFCKANKTDLIAVISKPHSVFYSLFAETHTKKLAFASKVPVIAIHN